MELNGSRHESDGKYIMIGLISLSVSILISMVMYVYVNRYEVMGTMVVVDKFHKTSTECEFRPYQGN